MPLILNDAIVTFNELKKIYPTKHLCILVQDLNGTLFAQIFCIGAEFFFFGAIWDKFALYLMPNQHFFGANMRQI